jgi:hypothetical protein
LFFLYNSTSPFFKTLFKNWFWSTGGEIRFLAGDFLVGEMPYLGGIGVGPFLVDEDFGGGERGDLFDSLEGDLLEDLGEDLLVDLGGDLVVDLEEDLENRLSGLWIWSHSELFSEFGLASG